MALPPFPVSVIAGGPVPGMLPLAFLWHGKSTPGAALWLRTKFARVKRIRKALGGPYVAVSYVF